MQLLLNTRQAIFQRKVVSLNLGAPARIEGGELLAGAREESFFLYLNTFSGYEHPTKVGESSFKAPQLQPVLPFDIRCKFDIVRLKE